MSKTKKRNVAIAIYYPRTGDSSASLFTLNTKFFQHNPGSKKTIDESQVRSSLFTPFRRFRTLYPTSVSDLCSNRTLSFITSTVHVSTTLPRTNINYARLYTYINKSLCICIIIIKKNMIFDLTKSINKTRFR